MNNILKADLKPGKNVILWLLLCLAMLVYLYHSLQVQSDIGFFLPSDHDAIDSALQHQLTKGEAGKIILIALQAKNQAAHQKPGTEQLARLNKTLAVQLQRTDRFTVVENGQVDASALIIEPFYRYRYLLNSDNDQSFDRDHLAESFAQLLQRIQFMLSPVEQTLFAEDPQMIWLALLKGWQSQELPKHHGVWFDQAGEQTLLFVKTQAEAYDLQQQRSNLDIIDNTVRKIFAHSEQADALDYIVSGAAVFALESKKAISKQIQMISVIASLTLMLFLYWVFRSIKIILIIGLPLAFAILTGMTLVMLLDGYIHGISIAFGITIIGIAVDYPVHFFSHHLYPGARKKNSPARTTIDAVWPLIRLGLLTTLIGFSAIILSEFSGLRQLGLFAVSGLLAAALFTRFVLPPLTALTLASTGDALNHQGGYARLRTIIRRPTWPWLQLFAIALPVLALLYIVLNHQHLWQKDLAALSPVPQWQKQQDFQLRKAMGLPELRYALILQDHNIEALLQRCEHIRPQLDALQQQGIISGYDMAARYLPSIQQQQQQQQRLPSASELQQRLETVLANSDLNAQAFTPFVKAVDNSKALPPLSAKALVSDSQPAQNFISTKIKTLLYTQTQHNQTQALWTALVPLQGVSHDITQHPIIKQLKSRASLLDVKTRTETMLAGYRNEALLWFGFGVMLILLVLLTGGRKIKSLLPLAWPFAGAVLLTMATLLLMGYSLSIFHLVTLLLVVGLGIDYSIFTFLPNQPGKQMAHLPEVARVSVIICVISTLIMFGALALSELPVLKAIGLTASLGALYAFLLTLMISTRLETDEHRSAE